MATTSPAAVVRPLPLPFGSNVAGVSFRQAELRDVVEGDHLQVVAAEDNPHDANACEVRSGDGALLGFIPAALAERLRATGAGPWPATLDEVLRGETWGLRIKVHPAGTELPGGRKARTPEQSGDTVHGVAGPATQPDGDEDRGTVRTVRASSGRELGQLVRVDGSRVVVNNGGREIAYPASVVVIDSAG